MSSLKTIQIEYDRLLTIRGLVTKSVAKKQRNVGNDAKEPCSFWKTKASIVALTPQGPRFLLNHNGRKGLIINYAITPIPQTPLQHATLVPIHSKLVTCHGNRLVLLLPILAMSPAHFRDF